MRTDLAPGGIEVLGEGQIHTVEVAVARAVHISVHIPALRRARGRVAYAHRQRRHPLQAELPFLEELELADEVPVLVEQYKGPVGGAAALPAVEDGEHVAHFKTVPESQVETV